MRISVLVMRLLKLTPCAQVKWDIIGDIQDLLMTTLGLMQERASSLNASQKQVNSEQIAGLPK